MSIRLHQVLLRSVETAPDTAANRYVEDIYQADAISVPSYDTKDPVESVIVSMIRWEHLNDGSGRFTISLDDDLRAEDGPLDRLRVIATDPEASGEQKSEATDLVALLERCAARAEANRCVRHGRADAFGDDFIEFDLF